MCLISFCKNLGGAVGFPFFAWVVNLFFFSFPPSLVVWDFHDVYISFLLTYQFEGLDNYNCLLVCERDQLWSTAHAQMNSFSKVKPNIPTEPKHGLTHVVQMRHLKHFGYSALSHYLISTSLARHSTHSTQDETNAFFWLWHFKVWAAKEVTVPNYVKLSLASQNHKHIGKKALR